MAKEIYAGAGGAVGPGLEGGNKREEVENIEKREEVHEVASRDRPRLGSGSRRERLGKIGFCFSLINRPPAQEAQEGVRRGSALRSN